MKYIVEFTNNEWNGAEWTEEVEAETEEEAIQSVKWGIEDRLKEAPEEFPVSVEDFKFRIKK